MNSRDWVETTLDRHPEAQRDNRYLILHVWNAQGLELTAEQWARVPSLAQPETLRRTRAKLQNEEGRFLPWQDLYAGEG